MKLFVWANPYTVSYGSTMFFAVAETVEEAREIARKADAYAEEPDDRGPNKNGIKLLEPTRVVDLPCGEWHKWEE